MDKKIIEIRTTTDYSIFNRLVGNRDVTNKRVAIIKKSIESIGYISNPIICNEDLEVIDGQGRLEALRQLNMPVEYRIIPNIGIEECRAMNLKPTSWSLEDFIKSYAEYGNENYIRLVELNNKYKFGYTVIYSIFADQANTGESSGKKLRSGSFVFPQEDYERVKDTLKYLQRYEDIQKRVGGRKEVFYTLIAWVANLDGVDKERLCVSIHQQVNKILPCAKCEDTLRQISEVYNYGYPKKSRRMFEYEFRL